MLKTALFRNDIQEDKDETLRGKDLLVSNASFQTLIESYLDIEAWNIDTSN